VNNLSLFLSELGRREEALAAAEEAAGLYRQLGRRPPGRVHAEPRYGGVEPGESAV